MSDNPFLEPERTERTVIRPLPGGRRAKAPLTATPVPETPRAPASGSPVTSPAAEPIDSAAIGADPLAAAAAPLLQLMARLRNTAQQPDPADLRERAVAAMRQFEQRVRDAGIPIEQLRPAHYALCASLDDVVQNTPWGSTGVWDAQPLGVTFHQDTRAGERFFELLAQMRQNPGMFLPVIELMYLCMSLGFQGRYRLSPRGPAELDRLREETYALIMRQRQPPEPELSPHWKGNVAPYRPLHPTIPVWVAGSAALAVVAALFVWFLLSLNAASDDIFTRMQQVPPVQMPQIARAAPVQPPPPAVPPRIDPLCAFLQPEIDQGLVKVLCNRSAPIVRILNRGMFAAGSAIVEPRFMPLLDRVGRALKAEEGQVQVIGYTDDRPIHSVQFPSNFQLSVARAEAAKNFLSTTIGGGSRLVAEGRGEADPIASNATPEGREQNRRIEIVLHRPSSTP
jgi:type VI secretion system protein ImpK